jgi:hypothetical protein
MFEEWIERNGDDNNWFEPLFGVNSKGETEILASPGDWRNRDSKAKSLVEDTRTPPEETDRPINIDDAKCFAWICVAVDSLPQLSAYALGQPKGKEKEIREEMERLTLEEWPEWYMDMAIPKLKEMYNRLDTGTVLNEEEDPDKFDRKQLSTAFEKLHIALNYYDKRLPFAEGGTPYEYRAFRLFGADGEGETVLAVDIHT